MMDLGSRLGIQSWCFRASHDHETLIEQLLACGVQHVEMCGVHLDPTSGVDYAPILAQYARHGIAISAFGVQGFDGDEAKARKIFEFACAANFPTISADLAPGGLAVVENLCAEYGKKVAIHNHGRHHRLGSIAALEELFSESTPNVGLCLDTAWALDSGDDPVWMAEHFRDRLYGLHLKDFVFDRAGKPEDVVVGTGNLDLPALLRLLTDTAYDGYLTIEYEGDVENPVPALQQCVHAVHDALPKTV